jgi:hypothetical protein
MFAYRQMTNSIKSRARRFGIKVYEVNPMATSIIGRYKYICVVLVKSFQKYKKDI